MFLSNLALVFGGWGMGWGVSLEDVFCYEEPHEVFFFKQKKKTRMQVNIENSFILIKSSQQIN